MNRPVVIECTIIIKTSTLPNEVKLISSTVIILHFAKYITSFPSLLLSSFPPPYPQELEQVPLFMTQSPEEVDAKSSPAVAALQDLKYSEATPPGTMQSLLMWNLGGGVCE